MVIVSSKVSPLLIELSLTETLIRSAPNLFAATSKLVLVRVESSKKRLKIVRPLSRSDFFNFSLFNLIYLSDSFKKHSISFFDRPFDSIKLYDL